jgi:predicted DNA-binding protein
MSREVKYPIQRQIRMSEELDNAIVELANRRGANLSDIMRTALEDYIINAYAKGEIK